MVAKHLLMPAGTPSSDLAALRKYAMLFICAVKASASHYATQLICAIASAARQYTMQFVCAIGSTWSNAITGKHLIVALLIYHYMMVCFLVNSHEHPANVHDIVA